MFLHVTCLRYLDKYRLHLTFNNQRVKIVDLQNEIEGEIFEPLAEISFFRQVYLNDETGTTEWPNGADFAPKFLFDIGNEVIEHNVQYDVKRAVGTQYPNF